MRGSMMRGLGPRSIATWVVALVCIVALTGCSRVSSSDSIADADPSANCAALFESTITEARSAADPERMNAAVAALSEYCPSEYDVAVDYLSSAAATGQMGLESCSTWSDRGIEPAAIELLRDDALCTGFLGGPDPNAARPTWPNGGLAWDAAAGYTGSTQRVCGPLASVRGTPDGVFVNIGFDYPNPSRFAFVLWGDWYLDPIAAGSVICASGTIYLYEGVAQIEIAAPSDLEIFHS